jgi:myo-inositol-1(or 4)-monophosphatase
VTFTPDINQIRGWITEAGQIALHYFRNVDPEWKGIANPVTAADREIERLLTRRIHEAYPDHTIIGEEYGLDKPGHQEYIWIIDPIDGTRSYVQGLPTWSITIALLHHRKPAFGLVYIPMINDWTYTDGDDVINNGVSIRDCLKSAWSEDSFLLARSDANAWFNIHFTRVMGLGSTATHLAYVARGSALALVGAGSYVWDLAAGAAFLARQGGEIRTLSGDLLDFDTLDLTKRIEVMYVAAHANVIPRLIPLLSWRDDPLHHPRWE